MPNVTMTIEDELLRKARKLAAARNTTLTALVRGYLRQLALREDHTTNSVIAELKESFDTPGVVVGRRTWKRADLHAR
jgi:hypothetical protein